MKLCRDCIYYTGEHLLYSKCVNSNTLIDLVNGHLTKCEEARHREDLCGREAKYFKEKEQCTT